MPVDSAGKTLQRIRQEEEAAAAEAEAVITACPMVLLLLPPVFLIRPCLSCGRRCVAALHVTSLSFRQQ
eukprot:gene4145-4394_t